MRLVLDRRSRMVALGAIVLLGLVFRVWGLAWGLHDANISRRPHPDEWVIYWLFQWFDSNHSLDPCPSAPQQCFFDWPPGFLYLAYAIRLALSPILGHIPAATFGLHADPVFARIILAGRLTSALMSTLTILVVYRLGTIGYGPGTGLVAALLVAVSGLLIQLAHFATPDSSLILMMSLSLLLLCQAVQHPSPSRFGLAGVLVGLSAAIQYNLALLLIPLTVAWLLAPQRRLGWLAIAVSSAVAVFATIDTYALVHFSAFHDAILHSAGMRTVNAHAQDQDEWAPDGPAWLYVVRFPLGFGVGFALTFWMVAGAAAAFLKRSSTDLVLLSWVVPYFILVTVSPAKFMRYSAPLLPVLALFAAAVFVRLIAIDRFRVRALAAAAALFAVLYSTTYDAAYVGLFSASDSRTLATSWLQQHARPGTIVEFDQLPNGLVNLPYFVAAAGFRPCVSQFKVARLSGPMRYVLLDSYDLDEHPRVATRDVLRFERALERSSAYRQVAAIGHQPKVLGITFGIRSAPQDWRYPSHQVMMYQHLATSSNGTGYCYANLPSAIAHLYVGNRRQT